jgi:transcriptional regulator GlxA family with amidase domain
LTDHSATAFIRVFRLKRAMSLLEQNSGNISEVAYAVGFNSVSYFNKCFKKQFGKTPSDFINA